MWPFNRTNKLVQGLGQHPFTRDMAKLEEAPYHLVFLCDDMKFAHQHSPKIRPFSRRVCRGFTQQSFDFRVGKYTGKALPFMGGGLKVKGEIHAVESRHVPVLDNHYRNGVEFARVRVNILAVTREHHIMPIGSEGFLKNLPEGAIRTVPGLGIRHYTSNRQSGVVEASMYVAMQAFWNPEDFRAFPNPMPEFPKDNIAWLPKYYNYPIERNRCPPIIPK